MEVHPNSKPTKERKASKVGHSSSKKIPEMQASPHSQESMQQMVARKKPFPIQREMIKGPEHFKKAPPESAEKSMQLTSHSKSGPPNPSPSLSPQKQRQEAHELGTSELSHTEPLLSNSQSQKEKRRKVHHSGKKTETNLPQNDLAQNVGASNKEPSLKREISKGLSPINETTQEGPAKSLQGGSAPMGCPGRREQVHKKGRSVKKEVVLKPLEQKSVAATQKPVKETQGDRSTSQIRESSVQRDTCFQAAKQRKTDPEK
jgi:hypothetical protein